MDSCSSTFQRKKLRGSSWLSDLASTPVVNELHHPMGTPSVTAAQVHRLHRRRARFANSSGNGSPIFQTDSWSICASCTCRTPGTPYKYQPRLEKRFEQLKSVHNAAPTLFKKVERVEAMMFVFFMALILQSVIEREVRLSMKDASIDAIPVYPEHRLAYHPTTAKIFDRFNDVSLYRIVKGGKLIKQYQDELTATQLEVLSLLGMSEHEYWSNVIQS